MLPLIRKFAILSVLCLTSTSVFADDGTLSWKAPTKNKDGTNIPTTGNGKLAGFKIYYKLSASGTETVVTINNPAATTFTITGLGAGTWNFNMTAYTVGGAESDRSTTVNKTITAVSVLPAPPGSVSVTIQTDAYNVVKKANGFVLVRVGTVPLNTPCDLTQFVNGYYSVPTSAVTWAGTVKPIVVVAKCSQ